jgi:SAM-dependent methyltransferase
MPTVEENRGQWDGSYLWHDSGDEWSVSWGGPSMQWYGSILPRIHAFVPTNTILEIACGYGRWTQFLKDLCGNLVAVDLSERCVQACKQRFSDCPHISYFVNDGQSLDMISNDSVDFAFSFDSLVHADESVLKAYISQLPRILTKHGAAFIHHSNLGEYPYYSWIQGLPKLRRLLSALGILEGVVHWRDVAVTAKKVERYAAEYGLRCISQEVVTWRTRRVLIDCMSTMVREDSPRSRENRVLRNASFTREIDYLSRLSRLYGDVERKGA